MEALPVILQNSRTGTSYLDDAGLAKRHGSLNTGHHGSYLNSSTESSSSLPSQPLLLYAQSKAASRLHTLTQAIFTRRRNSNYRIYTPSKSNISMPWKCCECNLIRPGFRDACRYCCHARCLTCRDKLPMPYCLDDYDVRSLSDYLSIIWKFSEPASGLVIVATNEAGKQTKDTGTKIVNGVPEAKDTRKLEGVVPEMDDGKMDQAPSTAAVSLGVRLRARMWPVMRRGHS